MSVSFQPLEGLLTARAVVVYVDLHAYTLRGATSQSDAFFREIFHPPVARYGEGEVKRVFMQAECVFIGEKTYILCGHWENNFVTFLARSLLFLRLSFTLTQ